MPADVDPNALHPRLRWALDMLNAPEVSREPLTWELAGPSEEASAPTVAARERIELDFGELTPHGEARFELPTGLWATPELVADWTGWTPHPLERGATCLEVTYALADGTYRYGYMHRGIRVPDPYRAGELTVSDGGLFSVLRLERYARRFSLAGGSRTIEGDAANPSWLSVTLSATRANAGTTIGVGLRPERIPVGPFSEELVVAQGADEPEGAVTKVLVTGRMAPGSAVLVPHSCEIRPDGLVVSGQARGTGRLRVRVFNAITLAAIGATVVECDLESATEWEVHVPFRADALRSGAPLLIDAGSRIRNLRFFEVTPGAK